MILPAPRRVKAFRAFAALMAAFILSCESVPPPDATPIVPEPPTTGGAPASNQNGGLAAEIRQLVESGTPPSLIRALDLIRSRDLSQTEYGRAMNAAAASLLRSLYPDVPATLPLIDPPANHSYTRILKDVERGAYSPPPANSRDYLEYVLPFLALIQETRSERFLAAAVDLESARKLSGTSVLEPFFRGLSLERQGKSDAAYAAYAESYARSQDCYPAALGLSRILTSQGKTDEALSLINGLLARFPDTMAIKRELARLHYLRQDWTKASPVIAEVLQRDSKNSELILMRAHVLVELSSWMQAQPLLDSVASSEANNRLYLFLRARVQAEGLRNRDSAIAYLRTLVRLYPQDESAQVYLARLLIDSANAQDLEEGRRIIASLLVSNPDSVALVELSLRDAMRAGDWKAAESIVTRLLQLRRTVADLRNAYTVFQSVGKTDQALAIARELQGSDSANPELAALFADALIKAGLRQDALVFIEDRLAASPAGTSRSRFYYLRSRLRTDEEASMGDLRSSLFEDPRNVDALIAMLEIYRARKDDKRAVYYLKQALALAPENPVLKKYQKEYASLLTQP